MKEAALKTKLYDFSVGMAIVAGAAAALLLYVFGYHAFKGSIFAIVVLVLVLLGIGFLVYYFVIKAPELTDEGVRSGKLFVRKENLFVEPYYDPRFRESVYRMRDNTVSYSGLNQKELAKKLIRVEATPSNRKKLEAYTGQQLIPAQKPAVFFRKKK